MAGNQRVSLTETRLFDILNKSRKDAFQRLIKRCIVRNIDWYVKNDVTKQRFQGTISPPMRNEILIDLLKPRFIRYGQEQREFDNIMQALPYLLNSLTREINLCSLFRCCPEDLKEVSMLKVFNLIAQKAADMEMLSCTFKAAVLSKPFVESLIKMKQLRVLLLIGGTLHWQDFVEICKNLPNLIDIQFSRFDKSADHIRPLEMKRNLKDISHLKGMFCEEISCQIMEFFEKNLPDFEWFCIGPLTNHAKAFLLDGNSKKTAKTRLLLYRPLYHPFAKKIPAKFPNIVSYQMDCHEAEHKDSLLQYLPDFPVLQSLCFARLKHPGILYHALTKYGEKLRKVTVTGDGEPSLNIKLIFELSPNLEDLELAEVRLINHSDSINYSRLTKLTLLHTSCNRLSSFLLAPQLQAVTICGHFTDLAFLCFLPLAFNVIGILSARQYQYAKMVKISQLVMVLTDFENISVQCFTSLSHCIKYLSDVCVPFLTDFNLFYGEIGKMCDVFFLEVDPFHRIDLPVDANLIEILKAYE